MYLKKFDLSGRAAFVTGAGRGIGLCAAEALLEAGARVVISDADASLLVSAKAQLAGKGEVEAVALDITDAAAVGAAARQANARFGAIDILVANAGIAWPDTGGEDMPDEAWRKVIDVDLNGAYWSCREFGRAMLARGRGAIVTVGSMSGLISNKPQRQVPLQCGQGRRASHDEIARRRMGGSRRPRQLRGADLCRHGDVERRVCRSATLPRLDGDDADEARRPRRRDRLGDPVPRFRRGERDHRLGARCRLRLHDLVARRPEQRFSEDFVPANYCLRGRRRYR